MGEEGGIGFPHPTPTTHTPLASNPPAPPTSVRLPPRLPTHSPPDCRRGNNLQPNQHNVSSNNEFPSGHGWFSSRRNNNQ
ncbi:hypothetical protein QLX08_002317 [Tetragonisca angustula]|uniref:Uncharacterized protein n=1 Tax=Tetragonisca angustula TaxID=166442 RepID=A0AAW1ABL7_9HYME